MTIRLPEPGIADKLLKFIGKKRAVYLPKDIKFADHSQIVGQKENFFKAFLRPSSEALPYGAFDIFCVKNLHDEISKRREDE